MKPVKLVIAVCLVAVFSVAAADATTLMPLKLKDMARLAPVVLVGRVEKVESGFNSSRTKIYTRAEITPIEVLKGDEPGQKIVVKTIGGRVGDKVARLPGAPQFSRGEKVLVFIEPRKDNDGYNTLGLYLGKFRVFSDPQSGEEKVSRRAAEPGVTVAGADKSVVRETVYTLEEVRKLVRKSGGER